MHIKSVHLMELEVPVNEEDVLHLRAELTSRSLADTYGRRYDAKQSIEFRSPWAGSGDSCMHVQILRRLPSQPLPKGIPLCLGEVNNESCRWEQAFSFVDHLSAQG